jgi:signal transduction histidine kinase
MSEITETTLPIPEPAAPFWAQARSQIFPILTILYQILVIGIYAGFAIAALSWFRMPFSGVFLENTLAVNNMDASGEIAWNARQQGLEFKDLIIAIDGQALDNYRQYVEIIQAGNIGDELTFTVQPPDGDIFQIQVELQKYPVADRIAYSIIPFVIGMVFLGSGLWVLSLRRADAAGRSFSIFTASVALASGGFFDVNTTSYFVHFWTVGLAMAGGALFHLALIFPKESRWSRRWPFLNWAGYLITVIISLFALPTLFNYQNPYAYIPAWQIAYLFVGLTSLAFVVLTTIRRYSSPSPVIRQQAIVIMWSGIIAFTPIMIWFFVTAIRSETAFLPQLLLPLGVFPIGVAYAILRYRMINTDYIFSRAVLYAALTTLAVAGYALLVAGISLIFGSVIPANHPAIVGLMVFILALLLNPLKDRLQMVVDRIFFRGQRVYQERVQDFGRELNPAMEMTSITAMLRDFVAGSLNPNQFHIFVLDTFRDQYVATPDETGRPTTDIQFQSNSALPQLLSREAHSLYFGDGYELPSALALEKARIALLGAHLFIPLPGREDQIIGFMALAPRNSGEPYTSLDLDMLTSLSDQTSMAIERAQVVSDLERRVNEMNVLIRVAQGINITLSFDDILELIFAQANRIIPAKDFWILLYDRENDISQYAFYLEDDRRLLEYENRPITGDIDLTQVVSRTGVSIVTPNYERESRSRGIIPQTDGLYGWVGLPLNAGAETIGAMSIGSRDPSAMYLDDQVALLQAIADQAAGAIVKARLLDASERNARQLNFLNEVGRSLTSTLDPTSLLDQILESAMEMINCEAGTLFLVDEESGELIFEVVKGPVALELQGKRLPPGTGHVGRSVDTGEPAIVNQARQTTEWSKRSDQRTGFETRDLLMVPMYSKDRIVGVVEVINRKDGLPFTQDDQDLLATFTSQAAIALENARLYTQTDQQLAERVDELSVMQRIDRELNASLDISQSMRITLEWAMRRSGADSGLVGAVLDEGVQVMADQGYATELDLYRQALLPIELPALKKAVVDEQTQQFRRSDLDQAVTEKGTSLLTNAQSQIVIPIRREEQVIGVLLLESLRDEPWTETTQEFLSRLSDHAAISISNAQLFAQVQEADIAKSDFISFVSHELKTPMTSIRGYTDLLIGGAVGAVNDAQENFLGTIRANVTRMATLVSDLADISRIEAGHLRLEYAAVEIPDVVDETIRSMEHNIKEKNQALEIGYGENLPSAWGDRTRIGQVLTNLVSNAYKYTPDDGIITIRADQVQNQWDSEGAPDIILLAVTDNGLGMTLEDQAQIFTKFFRSPDPDARQSPGTGLGLNITRNLVEMQGGKIWFESEYGKGTTFFFTVPIAEV